jgi:UDP-N-acetylmuramyl tripeptide synthase
VAVTGKVLTRLSPGSVDVLACGRRVVLVSGTNGKSTTSRLLRQAWSGDGEEVALNDDGANLLSGVGHALLVSDARRVVLEVDELVLPEVLRRTRAELVVLLNLSRDQLDRVGEVSDTRRLWQHALRSAPDCRVVANADDPMVVAAAQGSRATWVGAGLLWGEDALACPQCVAPLQWDGGRWSCGACGLAQPETSVQLADDRVLVAGHAMPLHLGLPGPAAASNATMALAAALHLGVDGADALTRMRDVTSIGGRYATGSLDGRDVRLLLMKNPASAATVLSLLAERCRPVVLVLNAEGADGRDPSWVWDVPFERLGDRPVVVCGRRAADLSVRLAYAGVPHAVADDVAAALALLPPGPCDVIANYTAFAGVSRRLAC